MLMMVAIWFYWKPPAEMIRLLATEDVPSSEVDHLIDPLLWTKLAFKPDLKKQDSLFPADYYLKDWPSLTIEDYDVLQVTLDGKVLFFEAEVFDSDSIWDAARIPKTEKHPYRVASYFFAAAALLVIVLRKRIFTKPKPLAAYTSVGFGYQISQGILLVGVLLLSLPLGYGVTNDSMGACGFLGAILLVTGLIAFPIYASASSKLNKRFDRGDMEVLADWQIPKTEWLKFVQHTVTKDIKKLLIILTAITVFGMFSAHVVSHGEHNEWMIMTTLGSIITAIWILTVAPALWKKRILAKGSQTIRVYRFGVLIGNSIQLWEQPNCNFGGVALKEEPVLHVSVCIRSTLLSNGGPVPITSYIKFPVPSAERQKAEEIVTLLIAEYGGDVVVEKGV